MKNTALNLKQSKKKWKPIPFLGFGVKIEDENGGFWIENGNFKRGRGREDKEKHMMRGKLKSFWKTV